MNDILMPQIKGQNITFIAIYKNQFKNWNLKDQITLTPYKIDDIQIGNICKVKIYNNQPVQSHYLVKIQQKKGTENAKQHLYAVSGQSLKLLFEKLITYKLKSLGQQFEGDNIFTNQIEGICLKKSQILGKWQQRNVKISSQNGLTSKKMQKEKGSLNIKHSGEIWTRFELLQDKKYFVVKIKYLIGKEEIAVPCKDADQWIKAFYSLFSP